MATVYAYRPILDPETMGLGLAAESLDDLTPRVDLLLEEDDPQRQVFEVLEAQYDALDDHMDVERLYDLFVGIVRFAEQTFPDPRLIGADTAWEIATVLRETLREHAPEHLAQCGVDTTPGERLNIEYVPSPGSRNNAQAPR